MCMHNYMYLFIYVDKHNKKIIHFSIDDTILIFKDITDNQEKYTTIFDNNTLKFLKECNQLYGAKFSIYCFGEFAGVKLSECTGKFKEEFIENKDWLNFGFHAFNNVVDYTDCSTKEAREDYEKVIKELKRIVGEESITTVVRLEKFNSNKENIVEFSKCEKGITGLLGADTVDRKNYYLNSEQNQKLFKKGYLLDKDTKIFLYSTDIRIEKIIDIEEINALMNDKELIVFTHEWRIDEKIKERIIEICKLAIENNYVFEFI